MALPLLRKNEDLHARYLEKSGAFQLLLWIIVLKPFVNTFVGMDVIGISISILQIFGFFIIISVDLQDILDGISYNLLADAFADK